MGNDTGLDASGCIGGPNTSSARDRISQEDPKNYTEKYRGFEK